MWKRSRLLVELEEALHHQSATAEAYLEALDTSMTLLKELSSTRLVSAVTARSPTTCTPPSTVVRSISYGPGSGPNQFLTPWGVAVHPHGGEILVVDQRNCRVQVINPHDGSFLRSIGSKGKGSTQFRNPSHIVVLPSGLIAVSDEDNHRIQVVKLDGTFIRSIGEGCLNYPRGLDVTLSGDLVVADWGNGRLAFFNEKDGTLVKTVDVSGEVMSLSDIAIMPCCWPTVVALCDTLKHRVVFLNENGTTSKSEIGTCGRKGAEDGQFDCPTFVTALPDGGVVVSDRGNRRLQFFTKEGLVQRCVESVSGWWGGAALLASQKSTTAFPTDGVVVADCEKDSLEILQ